MPTLHMQKHSDYEHMTTVNIAGIAGMVPGDRVYDTTLDRPMYYNNVSSAWERYIIVLNGQAAFPVGAVGAPGIIFDGDVDTGIYHPGADQISIATAGALLVAMDGFRVNIAKSGSAATPPLCINDLNTGLFLPAANVLGVTTDGTERMRAGSGGIIFIGDGTTTTNANMTIGLTIQQGGNDDEIFAGLSTDVDHGMTNLAVTDAYVTMRKQDSTAGGLSFRCFRDSDDIIGGGVFELIAALEGNADTTKTIAARGIIELDARRANGVGTQQVNADGNLVVIRSVVGQARAIFDAEGTLHLDLGGNGTAAAPSLTLAGNVATGFYQIAANKWGFSGAGSLDMTLENNAIGVAHGTYLQYGNTAEIRTVYDGTTWNWDINGADSKWNDAAIAAFAAGNNLDAEDTYWKFQDGGPDADSSGGNDGASFTYSAGDGSNAAVFSGQNGGDGGHVTIESGVLGLGDGVGVNGDDGLVYIRKSDSTGFWEDKHVSMGLWTLRGASDPNLSAWQPTGAGLTLYLYEFDNGDEVYFTIQIPHNYLEGSDLKPHVHWTPRARGVAENGNTVFWRLDYTIANINANFPAGATVNLHDTCNGVNERHELTDSGTISGVGVTISAELVCRLYRAAGDTWAGVGANNQPALLDFDIHYQTNTNGSRYETAK